MNAEILVAVISALALLATTWIRQPFRRDPRDHIERDLKIVAELPAGSDTRKELEQDIARRVQGLIPDLSLRRDWFGSILALAFLATFGFLTWRFGTWGGWWFIGAVVAGFLSLVMVGLAGRDFQKAPRDAAGKRIE